MEDYTSHHDDDDVDEESMLGALRSIGAAGHPGATINPLRASVATMPVPRPSNVLSESCVFEDGEPSLGEDNFDVIRRARESGADATSAESVLEAQKRYDELKRQHQVDLNDAKQLADLEDAGLRDHMSRARKQLADHERLQAELPSAASLRRDDVEARRALSSLMTSLKAQQMALQVACDDVLLQAANAQKLADGGQPHGYPTPDGQTPAAYAAKCYELLGKKVAAAGKDLAQVATTLESFERDLTLARRSYEKVVDGLTRRASYYEELYGEAAFLATQGQKTDNK